MDPQQIRLIIKAANQSFVDNKIEDFLIHCSDNITWTVLGYPAYNNKEEIRKEMADADNTSTIPEINTDHILVEGDRASCTGTMKMISKDGNLQNIAFSDHYRFEGNKIVELTSYIVNLKEK